MNSSQKIEESDILIAGKDYPRTYREFVTMFLNDESCREFLYKLRWNDNFICPNCRTQTNLTPLRLQLEAQIGQKVAL